MAYLVDERDVQFNLFEFLQIQNLKRFEAFSAFGEDDLKAFLAEALRFSQKEIAPLNQKSDERGARFENGSVTTTPGFKELYQAFAQNGFIGVDVPTTYGGQGLPVALQMPMTEFFGGSCVGFSMFAGLTRGAAHLIECFGTPELASLYCPAMYSGKWTGTMCLTEPQAGSALADIQTTAKPVGDRYQIKGGKIFISAGDHDLTENIIHLVLARIEGDPEGTKGISLFVVPKIRVHADGSLGQPNDVKTVNIEKKMGLHASPTCTLAFGDQDACEGFLVGERSKGMSYMFQMMNEARLLTGMQGLSLAGNAYQHALSYAKERIQGNKTAIVQYPDVKRMLATMKAYTEGLRALLYQVGLWIDEAEHETDVEKKEKTQGFVDLLTPVCKAFASDRGFDVTVLAVQTYGGYGYIREYPVEQMLRDVKISSLYEGTNGIQAMDLIGRKMMMKGGDLFRAFYAELDVFAAEMKADAAFVSEAESFQKALQALGASAMKLAERGMQGKQEEVLLHAVPLLNLVGFVVLGWLLLKQARLSLHKLEKLWKQAGAEVEEQKAALCESDPEARFYESKVKTARFFTAQILPEAIALSRGILNDDISALKIRF